MALWTATTSSVTKFCALVSCNMQFLYESVHVLCGIRALAFGAQCIASLSADRKGLPTWLVEVVVSKGTPREARRMPFEALTRRGRSNWSAWTRRWTSCSDWRTSEVCKCERRIHVPMSGTSLLCWRPSLAGWRLVRNEQIMHAKKQAGSASAPEKHDYSVVDEYDHVL